MLSGTNYTMTRPVQRTHQIPLQRLWKCIDQSMGLDQVGQRQRIQDFNGFTHQIRSRISQFSEQKQNQIIQTMKSSSTELWFLFKWESLYGRQTQYEGLKKTLRMKGSSTRKTEATRVQPKHWPSQTCWSTKRNGGNSEMATKNEITTERSRYQKMVWIPSRLQWMNGWMPCSLTRGLWTTETRTFEGPTNKM